MLISALHSADLTASKWAGKRLSKPARAGSPPRRRHRPRVLKSELNVCSYVRADPVNNVDPTGLDTNDITVCGGFTNEWGNCMSHGAQMYLDRISQERPTPGNGLILAAAEPAQPNLPALQARLAGPALPPDPCNALLPDGSTVNKNVDKIRAMLKNIARSRSFGESFNGSHGYVLGAWLALIQEGGKWDYKLQRGGSQQLGNLNYGATGSLLLPLNVLLRGAGAVQDPATAGKGHRTDLGPSDYGDQLADIPAIKQGAAQCKGSQ